MNATYDRFKTPTNERERIINEYFQTYDPTTGIKIAITLVIIFTIGTVFVIFKNFCRSKKDIELEKSIREIVNRETCEKERKYNKKKKSKQIKISNSQDKFVLPHPKTGEPIVASGYSNPLDKINPLLRLRQNQDNDKTMNKSSPSIIEELFAIVDNPQAHNSVDPDEQLAIWKIQIENTEKEFMLQDIKEIKEEELKKIEPSTAPTNATLNDEELYEIVVHVLSKGDTERLI